MANISEIFNETISTLNNATNESSGNSQGLSPPATPDALKDATRVIYVIVFIVGVVGNAMVCCIILKRHNNSGRRSIHTFTLNLAFSDLLVLLIYLPSQLHLFETNMIWEWGDIMCRITYLVVPLSIYSSVATLIAISRDRYVAVIHPMVTLEKRNTKYILLTIWAISFFLTIPLILVAGIESGYCTEVWPNRFLSSLYWIFAFCVQFAIPVFCLAVAHILIVVHLHRLKTPFAGNKRAIKRKKQQQRLIRMSICLVLVYVICILPQHIVFFWMLYGDLESQPFSMYIFQVANLMLIMNSALNPVVYGTLNKDIKRGILNVFLRRSKKNARNSKWTGRTIELQTITSYSGTPLLRTTCHGSLKSSPAPNRMSVRQVSNGHSNFNIKSFEHGQNKDNRCSAITVIIEKDNLPNNTSC